MGKIIIIGGVAAGMTFASKLNREKTDLEHVLYEKRDYTSLGACGIPFVIGGEAPNGLKDILSPTYKQQIDKGINIKIKHEVINVDFDKKSIEVKDLETNKLFSDNYTKLVIATGAKPRKLNVPGHSLKNIHYATTYEDAKKWVEIVNNKKIKNILIVGSGFIGLEMAENLRNQNKNITIVEALERPVSNILDQDMTNNLNSIFKKYNVNFKNNEIVELFEGRDNVEQVVTNKNKYQVDAVLICIGFVPNTNLFVNKLETLPNGAIKINDNGQTSIKDVYAAGDCAAVINPLLKKHVYVPLATTSRKMSTVIFDNLIKNKNIKYQGSIGTSGFRFFEKEFFATGLNEKNAKNHNINYFSVYVKGKDCSFYSGKSKEIHLKLICDHQGIIIGGQSFGENKSAALRIAVIATAITKKMTIYELEQLDLFYTPPFSSATDILAIAARQLIKRIN